MNYFLLGKLEQRARLAIVGSCVGFFLVACGGGATNSSESSPDSSLQPAQITYTAEAVSLAESVYPPELTQFPVQAINSPPPKEGPPPKLPLRLDASSQLKSQDLSAVSGPIRPHIVRQVVATELAFPTDLAVSSDADLIYTELRQGLVIKRASRAGALVWTPRSLGRGNSVTLSSVAIDPDFSANRMVYILLLEYSFGSAKSDLVRLKLNNDLSSVLEQKIIFTTTFAADNSTQFGVSPQMGGKVRVGPEGYLYVSFGDFRSGALAQSPTLLGGKVLRITKNGQPAPGNHGLMGSDPMIFAFGVRSPAGISFQPNTEELVLAHQSTSSKSELSAIRAGANGGWNPSCQGSKQRYCESAGLLPVNWRTVIAWNASEKGSITGIERLRGQAWRDWKNALAVAFDQGGGIGFFAVDASGQVTNSVQLLTGLDVSFGSIADGPDGLYALVKQKNGRHEVWKLING